MIRDVLFLVGFILLGSLAHEVGHLVLGRIFGGGSYFSKYRHRLPVETDFESPGAMANWQVRVTAGVGYIFLLIGFVGAWMQNWNLFAFGAGGGVTISHTDLIGAVTPEAWKKLTRGEEITVEDLQDIPTFRDLFQWILIRTPLR